MAKKPVSKIAKGSAGRKNHGPKRHLHHEIYPKALRMSIADCGVLDKYNDFSSFCLALQARKVRGNYAAAWYDFKRIGKTDKYGNWIANRQEQDEFLKRIAGKEYGDAK